MAICEVFSQSAVVKYKSTLCSKSTIFSCVTTFLTITLPFLLAYRSHGFWLRNSSYREQPEIQFKYSYLLYLETGQPDSPVLCSNLPVSQDYDRCTAIKSREEDSNSDGYYDRLLFEIEAEIPPETTVYSLQLVLIFDYVLKKQCLLQMESAGVVQFTSGLPFSKLEVTGDLRMVQKELLRYGSKDTRYNNSIFGLKDDPTLMYDLPEAMRQYAERGVTTRLENVYQTWTSGLIANEPFSVSVRVGYPEDVIHFRPPFWQIIKWAWMQYFALLIIFLHVSRSVKGYVFSNRLVPTMREFPWKKTV